MPAWPNLPSPFFLWLLHQDKAEDIFPSLCPLHSLATDPWEEQSSGQSTAWLSADGKLSHPKDAGKGTIFFKSKNKMQYLPLAAFLVLP